MSLDLKIRPRRLRQTSAIRELVAETTLSARDLLYPVFIHDEKSSQDIPSMPGQKRLCTEDLLKVAEKCVKLNIPGLALFPIIKSSHKSLEAEEAYNDEGLVQQTLRILKKQFPELLLISDVALDPFTIHGQDGITNQQGKILNDETVEILCKQALSHARAGADIVAPSDMMDGRIRYIRETLDHNHFQETSILSYTAKYASHLYSPFRDAIGSATNLGKSDKKTYQMDPRNAREALREVELDIAEGADMVMVKPGLPYLDIVHLIKSHCSVPLFLYQVSGEYSMIKAASERGWISGLEVATESLLCAKRAGADAILTYFALEVAQYIGERS